MRSSRFLAGIVLFLAAAFARAESTDVDAVTVGALAERADAAVIATAIDETPDPGADSSVWTFRVEEPLRGAAKDELLRVRVPAGRAAVARGGRFLAFLRSAPRGEWQPLELPWSLRTTADAAVRPLADYARGYAACLSPDGRLARPEALAEHLVASLASSSDGVAHVAGRDLVRHADALAPSMTAALRDRVTAALRTPRKPDQDLTGIVLAAGPFGGAGTDDLLVARLADPAVRGVRRHVVASLGRRASAGLVASLTAQIDGADAAARAGIANGLGRLDRADAEAPLVRLAGDEDPLVRVEASHGLGLLARAVRAPSPGADPDAPRTKLTGALAPLLAALDRATTENERRAVLWAVAQIDVPQAWDALRRIAREAPDARVRALAAQFLARPRTALLLE